MNTKYGFVYLATLAVRAEPSDLVEMTNQLLFGDTYWVLEETENWLKIQNTYDQYEGWISKNSYQGISTDTFELIHSQSKGIVSSHTALISFENHIFVVSCASQIPLWNGETGQLEGSEIEVIEGDITPTIEFSLSALVKLTAVYLDVPYLWGGKSILGIDCSAFVQELYKCFGIKLPRDASQQAKIGKEINLENIEAGDLAFFQREDKIIHVGVYMGVGKIMHAFDQVRIDTLDETGIFNLDENIYTHFLAKVVRL